MEKSKKILIAILLLVMAVASTFLIKEHFFDKEEEPITTSIKGSITNVFEDKLELETMDGTPLFFRIGETTTKDQSLYYKEDMIKVVYTYTPNAPTGERYPLADAIVLLSRDEKALAVHQIIEGMSIEEKVAQLFMVRCPPSGANEALQTYQMGGYILFDDTIRPYTRDQFVYNNQVFQELSNHGLFIGLDEEGGTVNRVSWYSNYRDQPFASPQDLYNEGGFDRIRNDTQEKNALLKSIGVNMNFAPVADIATNPDDFMYKRSFAQSADETAKYISTVVSQMKEDGMASVIKHFPGYGNNSDTHTGSAYDTRSYTSFVDSDFIPFMEGIKQKVDVVLVSHNIVEAMDPAYPSSLSAKVHTILREDLKFQGIIITDDLAMDAITQNYGVERSAVLAILAGNDMLISSEYKQQMNAVINAITNGEIDEERINVSLFKILSLKYDLQIIK